jgi:hypothetical protein
MAGCRPSRTGQKLGRQIGEALDGCQMMLLVLSPNSVISENVEDEWNYYLTKKPVVTVLYQPVNCPTVSQSSVHPLSRNRYDSGCTARCHVEHPVLIHIPKYLSVPILPFFVGHGIPCPTFGKFVKFEVTKNETLLLLILFLSTSVYPVTAQEERCRSNG